MIDGREITVWEAGRPWLCGERAERWALSKASRVHFQLVSLDQPFSEMLHAVKPWGFSGNIILCGAVSTYCWDPCLVRRALAVQLPVSLIGIALLPVILLDPS